MSLLFFWSAPLAIAWFIVSIWVWPAVEAFPGRAFAHVGEKVVEAIKPAVADRDAAASIVFKPIAFWVEATSLHARPRMIGTRISALPRVAMTKSVPFSLQASTTEFMSFDGASGEGNDFSSAITAEDPPSVFFSDMGKSYADEASKAQSGEIATVRHV